MIKIFYFLLVVATLNVSNMRCTTNSIGVTTCRDKNGVVIRSRTNSIGVTTYKDNKGKKIRCRTNSVGITRCS